MEQRHNIILVDHFPRHDDGLGLTARHAAQDRHARLIPAGAPQKAIADGRDHNGCTDHGDKGDHPFVSLRQHRLVEGRADQNAKAKHHRLVEPAGDAKIGLHRFQQRAAEPDAEQAAHEIGRRGADLHQGPSRCQGDGKGYSQPAEVGEQPGRGPECLSCHLSQAPVRRSG